MSTETEEKLKSATVLRKAFGEHPDAVKAYERLPLPILNEAADYAGYYRSMLTGGIGGTYVSLFGVAAGGIAQSPTALAASSCAVLVGGAASWYANKKIHKLHDFVNDFLAAPGKGPN